MQTMQTITTTSIDASDALDDALFEATLAVRERTEQAKACTCRVAWWTALAEGAERVQRSHERLARVAIEAFGEGSELGQVARELIERPHSNRRREALREACKGLLGY